MCVTCEETNQKVKAMEHTMQHLSAEVGRSSSHSQEAAVNSAATNVLIAGLVKTTDRRYTEGRAEHKQFWDEITDLRDFNNRLLGIGIGGGAIVGFVWAMVKAFGL